MGQVNITITVDTELLKSLSTGPNNIYGEPPVGNNTWCTIAQEGGTTIPEDPSTLTNPCDLESTVYKDDFVTFYGIAKTVPGGELQPVINITQIDLVNIPEGSFGKQEVSFPNQNGVPSGSIVTMQAKNYFNLENSYNIHFSISYKCRIIDPKIKITHPIK
ncbi:MAG TPA: hypothetical protein VK169_09065 [Saprospiraceae bacterium]|nr:hypothetical protein [Saprospiraceae bacterium]